MLILVFNAGSSSLKFGVFQVGHDAEEVLRGTFERFRAGRCDFRFRHGATDEAGTADCGDVGKAVEDVPAVLQRFGLTALDAVGHRVAHGGAKFQAAAVLDDAVVKSIETLMPLAPLPRWTLTIWRSASGCPISSAARSATYLWDVPWKP